MSVLLDKQFEFCRTLSGLIIAINNMGYRCKFGPSKDKHMANSLHEMSLAQDLLTFKNGVYLKNTEEYQSIGELWEAMGGTWGGRFGDGNHFSFTHDGVK